MVTIFDLQGEAQGQTEPRRSRKQIDQISRKSCVPVFGLRDLPEKKKERVRGKKRGAEEEEEEKEEKEEEQDKDEKNWEFCIKQSPSFAVN